MAKPGPTAGEENGEQRYGIGAVARLTGISVHTLRVWERRYAAVEPERTDSERRLYSAEDVERLTLLKRLVDRGETIGRIAKLSRAHLDKRMKDFERHATERLSEIPGRQRVAVFGEFLGLPIEDALAGAEIVTRGSRLGRFRSDIRRSKPDVLLLEMPIVNEDTHALLADLRAVGGADRLVVVYDFGRRADIARLNDESAVVLRAPVTAGELDRAIASAGSAPQRPGKKPEPKEAGDSGDWSANSLGEPPPRRYSRNQLARLTSLPSTVDCECPFHLAELIDRLSLFEEYSADCENRNREDAALHAYLHTTTAHSRALIETALARIIEVENLDPGPP